MSTKEKLEKLYNELLKDRELSARHRFAFLIEVAAKISRIEEFEATLKTE